jgi:chromosome segregation ATPase
MARSGLTKSDIKSARNALIARGRYPSADAVRAELGDTGSKSTIHRYLKELEDEEGTPDVGSRASISEPLQDLVARLAERLHEEAEAQVAAMRQTFDTKASEHAAVLSAANEEKTKAQARARELEAELKQKNAALASTRAELQVESTARQVAEQLAVDLNVRLMENEAHRLSLEEKHQHARDALEHYWASIKDQRDADERRHEQQLQQMQAELRQAQQTISVKQEETTRLNQDGARLIAELGHARQAQHAEEEKGRRLGRELDELRAVKARHDAQALQLADKDAHAGQLQEQLAEANKKHEESVARLHDAELALAQSRATAEAQQGTIADLRAALAALQRWPAPGAGGTAN